MPRAWLTPDSLTGYECRSLLFPQGEGWEEIFRGALLLLANEYNFEQQGAITPAEAAEAWGRVFDCWVRSPCLVCRTLEVQADHLLAFWPLWEFAGLEVEDIAGNERHGAAEGVLWGAEGPAGAVAARLDGVNDQVDLFGAGVSGAFDPDSLTLAFWVRMDAAVWSDSNYHFLAALGANASNRLWFIKGDGYLWLYAQRGGTGSNVFLFDLPDDDNWHHVALVMDTSAGLVLYLDGALAGSSPLSGTWSGDLATFYLGSMGGSLYHQGDLALAGLWDVALDPDEIAYLVAGT